MPSSLNADKGNVHNISEIWGFIVIVTIIALGMLTQFNYRDNLPEIPETCDIRNKPNSFIANRAWKDLKNLTGIGPRITGSQNNEVFSVDFIKRGISNIEKSAHPNQHIEMDIQVVSGAYWADFKPYGMTSLYSNVQNVVVKFNGQSSTSGAHSLLLNCHFDTVPGSPGASDDAGGCVIMLEVLRVNSRKCTPPRHSIVFLFNGAGEKALPALHGFITKHKWAKNIRAFINLASIGSGGKEMLFQSGPNNPWLLKAYGRSAPYPNGQSAAEEIFHSGLIKCNYDDGVFRDFGNIPGLNFAYVVNGYRHHTKFDHIDFIPMGTLQHTGDNILKLTKYISNSAKLNSINNPATTSIYFDIFGIWFVSYSRAFGTMINFVISILSGIVPYMILSQETGGINKKHLRLEIYLGFLSCAINMLAAIAICCIIAFKLDCMGKSMSWFSNTFICIPTYCLPSVLVQSLVHIFLMRDNKSPMSLALKTQARLIGISLFWGLLCAAITLGGIRTAYVLMIPLMITLITNSVIGLMRYQNSILKWLYVHLVGQILVVLWISHYYHIVMNMFIPASGFSGASKNPDIVIGVICAILTIAATSYVTPLIVLLSNHKTFLGSMFATYMVTSFLVIGMTHYGFPYRDESAGHPTVQRHYITHTVRTLYDMDGEMRFTDSGFWFRELDRNSRKTIESLVSPEGLVPQHENILCEEDVFCGLPYHSSCQLHLGGYWVPGPPPSISNTASLKLVSREKLAPQIHRLKLVLSGDYQVSLQIRPKNFVELQNWNLLSKLPKPIVFNNKKAYFVSITNGLQTQPMTIVLDLEVDSVNYDCSLVDISLVTLLREHQVDHTKSFQDILSKVPRWAYAVPSVASILSWTF